MKKSHIWVIIGGILIIIFFIWLTTSPAFYGGFDYSATGNIGDTIGGLSGPVIGIFGAYFVYISFQEQLNANKLQIEALNQEKKRFLAERWYGFALDRFYDIENKIDNLELIFMQVKDDGKIDPFKPYTSYKGINSIHIYYGYIQDNVGKEFNDAEIFMIDQYFLSLIYIMDYILGLAIEVEENFEIYPDESIAIRKKLIELFIMEEGGVMDSIISILPKHINRFEVLEGLVDNFRSFKKNEWSGLFK